MSWAEGLFSGDMVQDEVTEEADLEDLLEVLMDDIFQQ